MKDHSMIMLVCGSVLTYFGFIIAHLVDLPLIQAGQVLFVEGIMVILAVPMIYVLNHLKKYFEYKMIMKKAPQ